MPFGNNLLTGKPGPAPAAGRDGDVVQARHRVNALVNRGRIANPNDLPCADCGHMGEDRRHEYDHYKGYDAAHHLDVQPVCTACHAKRDSKKAKQTHCYKGHEFTEANTIIKKNGNRCCRECRREHDRNRGRGPEYWREYRKNRKARA